MEVFYGCFLGVLGLRWFDVLKRKGLISFSSSIIVHMRSVDKQFYLFSERNSTPETSLFSSAMQISFSDSLVFQIWVSRWSSDMMLARIARGPMSHSIFWDRVTYSTYCYICWPILSLNLKHMRTCFLLGGGKCDSKCLGGPMVWCSPR